jgi:uncharacterized protein YkwD
LALRGIFFPETMHRVRSPTCAAVITLACGALVSAASAGSPVVRPQATAESQVLTRVWSLEGDLLTAVNRFRAAHGLRRLRPSARLRAVAARHSAEMAQFGYFGHASPDGTAFWRRLARYYPSRGYRSWSVGENLEYGSPALRAAEVLEDWLRSPPHRANVLSRRFRDGGVGAVFVAPGQGVYDGLPTTIVTLDVGLRRR